MDGGEIVKIIIEFIRQRWYRKSTLLILVLFSAGILLWLFSGINLQEIEPVETWIIVLVLTILIVIWYFTNKIPKASKGKIGFAIGIETDDPEQQLKIKRDFIDTLRELLHRSRFQYSFEFIEIPDRVLEKIDSPDSARKTLYDLECAFMIYGKARTVSVKGQTQHVLNLEGIVAHKPIAAEISRSFSREFADLFPRRLMISSEGDLFHFEFTAGWIDIVSKCIIGIAALISGDVKYAQELFESLYLDLKDGKVELPVIIKIRERLPVRLRDVYLIRARTHYEDWKQTKDMNDLEQMKSFLDSLDVIVPTNVEGRTLRSLWYFVVSRDIVKAKTECLKSKSKQNAMWRYNHAFLLAYEGDLEKASKEYKLAFRGFIPDPSFIFEVLEFILWVLDIEPDKKQLYFCLGMIYYYVIKDYALALQDFEKFLETTTPTQFSSQRSESEKIIAKIQSEIRSGKIKFDDGDAINNFSSPN